MLPGVELARRRRVHYHGDVAAAGEHHGHYNSYHQHHHHQGAAATMAQAGAGGVVSPTLAARIRLEEKLRGAPAPSSSLSRWGRRFRERDGSAASRQQNNQQEQQLPLPTEPRPPSPAMTTSETSTTTTSHRREMRRTLSKVDICAVCLDEVQERRQRITRLPCSHKYHSECVLPWLTIQPDCPCCRTLVPSVDALLSLG
ncbi:hypothetical protein GUJ93_ZPchr0011g27308 [Zizania palustris]|uniref:RING-type domain-containing protein n=1 Tax=Zizania palustris TaxID=103762 RepID=A0A8J6BLF4_ZIZPA|nr:hypothetical protein GUJ93_ZPchr0011g27308 [Zizania palustris]